MALPQISQYPLKTLELPLSKLKLTIRPFVVKEEKVMILLRESGDTSPRDILNAVVNIAQACSFEKQDLRKIPLADLEYLFLNLRAFSKGKMSNQAYKCKNIPDMIDGVENVDSKECGNLVPVSIDLETVGVVQDPEFRKVFQVPNTDMKIHMKLPTVKIDEEIADAIKDNVIKSEQALAMALHNCIDMVTEGTQIYKDFTATELQEFMDTVIGTVLDEMKEYFFERLPVLQKLLPFKCDKCGHQETIRLEGLNDFF